jgi:hypothetical protein
VLFFGGVLVVLFILATLFFPRQIIALYKFGGGLYENAVLHSQSMRCASTYG